MELIFSRHPFPSPRLRPLFSAMHEEAVWESGVDGHSVAAESSDKSGASIFPRKRRSFDWLCFLSVSCSGPHNDRPYLKRFLSLSLRGTVVYLTVKTCTFYDPSRAKRDTRIALDTLTNRHKLFQEQSRKS